MDKGGPSSTNQKKIWTYMDNGEKLWELFGSSRFQALVIIAVANYLRAKGYIGQEEVILVTTILGGHVAIRTIDRHGENVN